MKYSDTIRQLSKVLPEVSYESISIVLNEAADKIDSLWKLVLDERCEQQ